MPATTATLPKTITIHQRVESELQRAKHFDAQNNVTMRDQVLRQMYDLPGATVRYIDAAITNAGFGFSVESRKRLIGR